MCLFLFTHLNECGAGLGRCLDTVMQDCGRMLRGCGKDLAVLSRDLLGFLLLLPGLVLGLVLVALGTVSIAAVKLVIGTFVQVEHSVRVYCATIQRGADAYRGGAPVPQGVPVAQPVTTTMESERIPVQVPPGFGAGQAMRIDHPRGAFMVTVPPGIAPGGTFFAELPAPAMGMPVQPKPWGAQTIDMADKSCASCMAEVYCCCAPFYALSLVFIPLVLTAKLVFAALGATLEGARTCCLPPARLLDDWWPAVKVAVQKYDRYSSGVALGSPGVWLLCACAPSGAASVTAELV